MMTFPRLSQYEDAGKTGETAGDGGEDGDAQPGGYFGRRGRCLATGRGGWRHGAASDLRDDRDGFGQRLRREPGGERSPARLGAPFALAEAFNRRTTFIAAFQIAQGMTESQLRDTGRPLRSSSPRTWSTRRRDL